MDRRSFLASIPFLPFAAKAIAAMPPTAIAPAMGDSLMEDINAIFSAQTRHMQQAIYQHISTNNPYNKLLNQD